MSAYDAHLLPSHWEGRYEELAETLVGNCTIFEPWVYGVPRFHGGALVLSQDAHRRLYEAARRIGALYQQLAEIIWAEPELLDSFYALSPWQKYIWLSSGGVWHGFARLDAFLCDGGRVQICEINADTPTGQIDAVAIGEVVEPLHPELDHTMAVYEERLWSMMVRYHQARTGQEGGPRRIGLVYPTDICEDITLMQLYTRWWEARGAQVVLGSPFNLVPTPEGGVQIFGQPVDMILRHYKTDWWAEQRPVWKDEPQVPDPDPLEEQLACLVQAEQAGRVSVLNPMGSLVPQSKLSMAFFWEQLHRFSPQNQEAILDLVPPTWRVATLGRQRLLQEREHWVLKSDFGCEGEEVSIGRFCSPEVWEKTVEMMTEGNWIAQRFFRASALEGGHIPNYGVYLIAGEPAGVLTRLNPGREATGHEALVAPTFVRRAPDAPLREEA